MRRPCPITVFEDQPLLQKVRTPVRQEHQQRLITISREASRDGPFGFGLGDDPKSPPARGKASTKAAAPKASPPFPVLKERLGRLAERTEKAFPMLYGMVELLVDSVKLAFASVRWFRFGIVAVWLGFRLILYSTILLPAFLQYTFAYFHDQRIKRRIPYGPNLRNYLDIYCPPEAKLAQQGKGEKVPVVVAVMGGAWIMGHRAWNAQLGLRLMDFGVLVFAVDYRNFPLGRIPDMVEDLSRAVGWVFAHVEEYGGDRDRIILAGQSAGAHLSSLLLLEHSLLEARGSGSGAQTPDAGSPRAISNNLIVSATISDGSTSASTPGSKGAFLDSWSTSDFKAYLGISGPYDLKGLEPHLISRGIYARILHSLSYDGDLAGCSPSKVLETSDWVNKGETAAKKLPPFYLFHGDADKSVPSWSSADFAKGLQQAGVSVTLDIRDGMTHTYPVIEGPMAGNDPQVEVILPLLFGDKWEETFKRCPCGRRTAPQFLLDLAGRIMPY